MVKQYEPRPRTCVRCDETKEPAAYRKHGKVCEECRADKGPMPCARCRHVRPRAEYLPGRRLCSECRDVPPPSHRIDEKPCHECHRVLPVAAYGPPRERCGKGKKWAKRWSTVCLECWAKRDAAAEERRAWAMRRLTTWQEPDGGWRRICCQCHEEKDLEADFYTARTSAPTIRQRYQYHCRDCQRERVNAYKRRRWEEDADEERRKHNVRQREWRARNNERYRAQLARHRERVKNDPVRHARKLEDQRLAYRLQREREGHPVTGERAATRGADPRLWLPVAPFVAFFEKVLAREMYKRPGFEGEMVLNGGVNLAQVCEGLGLGSRRWLDYRTGKAKHVDYAIADRVLTTEGLNWWDVWDEGDLTDEQLARLGGTRALDTAA